MIRTIERIARTAIFAVAFMLSASSAWANLVAEWNGDLADGSTKGKFTMSKDANDLASLVSFSDGEVALGETTQNATKGVVISWPDPTTDGKSFTSKKMTVVVQYSNIKILSGNTSLLSTLWNSTSSEYLIKTSSGNGTVGISTGVQSNNAGSQADASPAYKAPTKSKMLVCFSGDATDHPGVDLRFAKYENDAYSAYESAGYWDSKKVDNGTFYGLKIGGTIANIGKYYRPGMRVESVQIFDSVVTFPATARVTADSTWSALGWDVTLPNPIPDGTITYVVDVPDSAANSVTIDLEGATVNAKSIIFNVAAGKTVTLTGGTVAATSTIETTGGGAVVYDVSGVDVSGLTAGDGLKILAAATSANVNLPAASETLQYVLQQRSDGLYISALPKDYKWNTININFTYNNNGLSTENNVGMVGVPGNKWNNYEGTPASYYNAYVCDDTATQTQTLTGLDVTVSGSRGSWATSLNSASDLRHGYIDDQDADGKKTPTVEINGIPFNKYRAIVYHATEAANSKFGYDTVNGANLCYVDGVLKDGSGAVSWGSAGPKDGAHAIEEGVNTLVTGVYETKPFKVVGHRNDRGCIAAVQVVKVDEATIDTAGTYTLTGLFGSVGTTANLYVNVAENATLNIPSETTIGAIDFNIASGKTLTLTGAKLTATVGGFTVSGGGKVLIDVAGAGAVNYSAKVIDGRIYGASDIDLTSSAGGASLEIDPADGVYLHVEDVTATLALGSNSYLTGTYVTSSKQAAFSGITLQQFYDGGYALRGRFAGASIDKLGVESTGYNAYVTDDGEGNVTSIRYEMQAKNNELKCVVITLTPNAGNTGIDVVANGAYWAASSNNPGFSFLNDDGTKKAGVTNGTLGTAYNSSSSYSLYGLNIVGKCVKTLTLSGDETLTVGTDIASAYDTLTVTGSGTLTVSGILNVDTLVAKSGATVNLSETFGARNISIESGATVSHIGGDGSSFYWATLTGAGTLILDPGDGNSYKMSGSNTGYTGEAVVKSGTVKMGDATSFGPTGRSSSIRVKGGATLDTNGASNTEYAKHKNKVILEEGATFTSSVANAANFQNVPCTSITLEGDATVDASTVDVGLAQYYHYNSAYLNIGTYTLTKVGAYDFRVSAIDNIEGSGVIDVLEGTFSICNSCYNNHYAKLLNGTLKIAAGATFKLAHYYPFFTVKNIEINGTVVRDGDTSTLTVNGYISGTGTTPMLTLADGATLKPQSSTGGLRVTSSLTLDGNINVDLSEIDLTGKSKLAIITSPLQIDKDTQVATFTRGSNSEDWVLYSEEVSTGVYELGVKLNKTIESSLSWSGSSGTWSANGFNAVEDSFYNDANQTVVFADDAGSSSDPLAVAVSGDKTVNALNFTADNRNVTLSGDAITAATVSKSGGGVAIVNNALSGTTSISVTDGVLVLNPNGEVVSDVDSLDNGTLVIYVGAGVTRTVTESITATKIVKRGSGTLDLTGITVSSIPVVVDNGDVIVAEQPSANVTINALGTFTLKDAVWSDGTLFSGDGTLELLSTTGSRSHTATGSLFNGVFRLSNENSQQNNINPSSSAMFDASVRPEFICNSTSTHLGNGWNNNHVIKVRDLSGSGSIRSQWDNSAYHYTIETKQSRDTVFAGTFVSGAYSYNRYIDLSVVGDNLGDIHSLTISQEQNTDSGTSPAMSTLSISDNAKVIFSENGGWGYGHVIVGDDGYLECTNNAAVKKLTLNDGATLVFPTSSSCLSEITSITFSSGTVTVSYPSEVTPTSGTKLINWSSAPAGSFVFDDGTTTKQFGGAYGDYYMLEADATGLYIRKAVAVDSPVSSTLYTSVAGALKENNVVYLIAAPDESVTLPVGKTISNTRGVSTSNLTVSPTTDEYAVHYVNSSYTVASTAVTYYWTGAAGVDWGTRSNWKVAAANGPDATRDMETTDSVAFTDGAIVALDETRRVAGIAIDGTVYISAVDAATKLLETTGNITGTGALTLFDVTLANVATTTLTVAPAVNFTSDSELAATGGYGFTFNGAVSISDTIKVWNVNHSVAGTTTLNGNFTKEGGYGLILGAVTVAANTTPTISNGSITINGAVTVSTGATFTIPASGLTVDNSASFVLSGRSSVLVDNGSGASGKVSTSMTDGARVVSTTADGVTTYKVGYGTIFSVY